MRKIYILSLFVCACVSERIPSLGFAFFFFFFLIEIKFCMGPLRESASLPTLALSLVTILLHRAAVSHGCSGRGTRARQTRRSGARWKMALGELTACLPVCQPVLKCDCANGGQTAPVHDWTAKKHRQREKTKWWIWSFFGGGVWKKRQTQEKKQKLKGKEVFFSFRSHEQRVWHENSSTLIKILFQVIFYFHFFTPQTFLSLMWLKFTEWMISQRPDKLCDSERKKHQKDWGKTQN